MRVFLIAVIFFMGSTMAYACGNPLLYAMLFARYPDAKVVYESEIENRERGVLGHREVPTMPGLTYHQWSLANATEIASSVNTAIAGNLGEEETLTILLADEVYGIRFKGGAAVPEMVPPQSLNKVAKIDVFTTTNALRAIYENEIEWQAAIANNLVSGLNKERFGSVLTSE